MCKINRFRKNKCEIITLKKRTRRTVLHLVASAITHDLARSWGGIALKNKCSKLNDEMCNRKNDLGDLT